MFSSLSTCARHVSYSWPTANIRVDTAGGVPLTTETMTPRAGLGEAPVLGGRALAVQPRLGIRLLEAS